VKKLKRTGHECKQSGGVHSNARSTHATRSALLSLTAAGKLIRHGTMGIPCWPRLCDCKGIIPFVLGLLCASRLTRIPTNLALLLNIYHPGIRDMSLCSDLVDFISKSFMRTISSPYPATFYRIPPVSGRPDRFTSDVSQR